MNNLPALFLLRMNSFEKEEKNRTEIRERCIEAEKHSIEAKKKSAEEEEKELLEYEIAKNERQISSYNTKNIVKEDSLKALQSNIEHYEKTIEKNEKILFELRLEEEHEKVLTDYLKDKVKQSSDILSELEETEESYDCKYNEEDIANIATQNAQLRKQIEENMKYISEKVAAYK